MGLGVRGPFCADCGRCSAASAARAGVVRRESRAASEHGAQVMSCQWPRGAWCNGRQERLVQGRSDGSNEVAGRPACFSYRRCGAGSDSDGQLRREAIYLKERHGWEERVDYGLDTAHPRRKCWRSV
jgi:hypothetical protein